MWQGVSRKCRILLRREAAPKSQGGCRQLVWRKGGAGTAKKALLGFFPWVGHSHSVLLVSAAAEVDSCQSLPILTQEPPSNQPSLAPCFLEAEVTAVGPGSAGRSSRPKGCFWLLLLRYLELGLPMGGAGGTGCFEAPEEELSRRRFSLPKAGIL